jgi:predicted membrane protein
MSGRLAVGLLLAGAGTLWLLAALDVLELGFRTWIGIVLIGIGCAIVLTPGRHGLLVVLGVVLVLVGLPAVLLEENLFEGGIGESTETPRSSADLEPFRQGIGKLTVDLTEDGLPLDGATVEASLGIGELVVLVPPSTDVTLDAHVGVGKVEALGETESGVDVSIERISGTAGTQELMLELDVGIGNARLELR